MFISMFNTDVLDYCQSVHFYKMKDIDGWTMVEEYFNKNGV